MIYYMILDLLLKSLSAETYALIFVAVIFYAIYKMISSKYLAYKTQRNAYRAYWNQRVAEREKNEQENGGQK